MNASTYALVKHGRITHLSEHTADHLAQMWRERLPWRERDGAKLAVLDLAKNETPAIGDAVSVDSDGVATLERLAS